MDRVATGIPNLDLITGGGLPRGSLIVIGGSPGTGKTILAQQICFTNASPEHRAIYYTTLTEPHTKLIRHLEQFSWFDADALGKRVEFIHLPSLKQGQLEAFADEIARTSFSSEPSVIVIDSSRALHDFATHEELRQIVYDLASKVSHSNAILLFVGEYANDDITDSPEFAVADGIVQMANEPAGAGDRRWLRIAKMRGSEHIAGRHSFRIDDGGVSVYPRLESLRSVRAEPRVGRDSTGVAGLDDMLGGGLPTGSTTLVAGPSGSGKTVLSLEFVASGLGRNERCLYVSFQESERQLLDKARAFGWDVAPDVAAGRLQVLCLQPVELDLDVLGARIARELRPDIKRVVLDSLAEVDHAATGTDRFTDYAYSLVESFRAIGATTLLTSETEAFFGPSFELARGISFVVDNVILLRYAELESEIRRALGVIKMRDSDHTKSLVQFDIGRHGIDVKGKFAGLAGVLTGTPTRSEEKFQEFFNR